MASSDPACKRNSICPLMSPGITNDRSANKSAFNNESRRLEVNSTLDSTSNFPTPTTTNRSSRSHTNPIVVTQRVLRSHFSRTLKFRYDT